MLEQLIEDIRNLCVSLYNDDLSERDEEELRERSIEDLQEMKKVLTMRVGLEVVGE